MKRMFRLLSISLVMVCCLVASGCSCASPMNVRFNVTTEENGGNLKSDISIVATLNKKFREPANTPCYKKMKKGWVELDNIAERYQCKTSDCYKKKNGKYEKLASNEIMACIEGSITCYEKVAQTYYKLLEKPEGIYECYDAEGNYFERAIYNRAEKVKLSSETVISKKNNKLSYESEITKVPSEKNYSLIYEFEIKNNGSTKKYIEALEYDLITGGIIKESSAHKVKLTLPENRTFSENENKYYYVLNGEETITIKIEVKYLLTSDINKKGIKDITLNIPIVLK